MLYIKENAFRVSLCRRERLTLWREPKMRLGLTAITRGQALGTSHGSGNERHVRASVSRWLGLARTVNANVCAIYRAPGGRGGVARAALLGRLWEGWARLWRSPKVPWSALAAPGTSTCEVVCQRADSPDSTTSTCKEKGISRTALRAARSAACVRVFPPRVRVRAWLLHTHPLVASIASVGAQAR